MHASLEPALLRALRRSLVCDLQLCFPWKGHKDQKCCAHCKKVLRKGTRIVHNGCMNSSMTSTYRTDVKIKQAEESASRHGGSCAEMHQRPAADPSQRARAPPTPNEAISQPVPLPIQATWRWLSGYVGSYIEPKTDRTTARTRRDMLPRMNTSMSYILPQPSSRPPCAASQDSDSTSSA